MTDIEAGLLDFFSDLATCVTVTPGNLKDLLSHAGALNGKVLRIRRIGGPGDRDNDYPTISVQSYAIENQAHPRAALDLDQSVWQRLIGVLDGATSGWTGAYAVEDPSKTSGPIYLPYPDPDIAIVESIYRFTVRH